LNPRGYLASTRPASMCLGELNTVFVAFDARRPIREQRRSSGTRLERRRRCTTRSQPSQPAVDATYSTNAPMVQRQPISMSAAQTNTRDLARISSTGQDSGVSSSTASTAPTGANQRGEVAPSSLMVQNDTVAIPADPGSNASAAQSSQRTLGFLPQTASRIPLVALIGFAALCAGFGLRMQRRCSGAQVLFRLGPKVLTCSTD
jgi:hypothetical protein